MASVVIDLTLEEEARLFQEAEARGVDLSGAARELLRAPLTVAEAVALFDARAVSQGRAVQLCGLSRATFLDALNAAQVSPIQIDTEEELRREAGLA